MQYLQNVIFGLVTGSILLLGTVGFSMVRRTENFLNIAHGQMVALGAYIGWVLYTKAGLPVVLAGVLSVLLCAGLGWLLNLIVFKPIRAHGGLYLLFTSVGLAYIMHGTVEAIFGTKPKGFLVEAPHMFIVAGYPLISSLELLIIGIAAASAIGLHFFLTKTKMGMAVRAMSSDFHLARVRGINTDRVSSWVWLLSSGLAALAGFMLGVYGTVYTDMGWALILLILSAAVLGGLGSIYGVMLGAIIIGLGMDLSVIFINSAYRSAVAFLMIMIVLIFKPQGILGGGGSK